MLQTSKWKRWTRFRLSTLTIGFVCLVAVVATIGPQLRRANIQKRLKDSGARVVYGYELAWYYGLAGGSKEAPLPPWSPWMLRVFGKDLLCSVKAIFDIRSRDSLPLVACLSDVEIVSVVKNNIRDVDLHHLLELPRLRSLQLEQNEVTDEGLRTIGEMKTLEYLDVSAQVYPMTGGHPITDQGLKHLLNLGQLRSLVVQGTGVTADGVRSFHGALPNCQVARTEEEFRQIEFYEPTVGKP